MTLTWMAYALVIGLLVTGAGWCIDRGLSRAGLPTRWVWGMALIVSVALPASTLLPVDMSGTAVELTTAVPNGAPSGQILPGETLESTGEPTLLALAAGALDRAGSGVSVILSRGAAHLPTGAGIERGTILLWLATTGLLSTILFLSYVHLARRRRGWTRSDLRGRSVWLAPELGPAVIGFVNPQIVIPRWATALDGDALEMVLCHEEEHVRARDPLLLTLGLIPAILLPWNAALWMQLRGLRGSVEVDCDRRVLRRGMAPRRYGALLLRLGTRGTPTFLPAPAITNTRALLTRRLKAMKKRSLRATIPLTFAASLVGVGLLVMACEAERPTVPTADEEAAAEGAVAETVAAEAADSTSDPVFIIRGDSVVVGDLPGHPGATEPGDRPLIVVDGVIMPPETGIQDLTPWEISSIEVIRGEAAEALYGSRAANGVINITTTAEAASEPETDTGERVDDLSDSSAGSSPESPPESGPQPVFTPYEVAPSVNNREEVQEALSAEYPAHLRNAGIGGTVLVYLHINESGVVDEVLVSDSSGHVELDDAALRVARIFEFSPALNRDMQVAVWVQIPIRFEAR
jgi:TonB family protein